MIYYNRSYHICSFFSFKFRSVSFSDFHTPVQVKKEQVKFIQIHHHHPTNNNLVLIFLHRNFQKITERKSQRKIRYINTSYPKSYKLHHHHHPDLHILGDKLAGDKLSVRRHGPNESPEQQPVSQRHIDDDLLLRRLLLISNRDQIAPANPSNPAGDVEEKQSRRDELSPVPLVSTHNQMR